MSKKAIKLADVNKDAVMKIVDADGTLYAKKNDRIQKFVINMKSIQAHYLDRYIDYGYEIDNAMAAFCQEMIDIAMSEKEEE